MKMAKDVAYSLFAQHIRYVMRVF